MEKILWHWVQYSRRKSKAGLHSKRPSYLFLDDIDRLVLADLALKRAFLQTGSIRLYSRQPHGRAALSAGWMDDFRGIRNGLKLAHSDTRCPAGASRLPNYACHTCGFLKRTSPFA